MTTAQPVQGKISKHIIRYSFAASALLGVASAVSLWNVPGHILGQQQMMAYLADCGERRATLGCLEQRAGKAFLEALVLPMAGLGAGAGLAAAANRKRKQGRNHSL